MKRRVDASLRDPDGARAQREARARRHPRGRVLGPGPAADPRRQGRPAARARHARRPGDACRRRLRRRRSRRPRSPPRTASCATSSTSSRSCTSGRRRSSRTIPTSCARWRAGSASRVRTARPSSGAGTREHTGVVHAAFDGALPRRRGGAAARRAARARHAARRARPRGAGPPAPGPARLPRPGGGVPATCACCATGRRTRRRRRGGAKRWPRSRPALLAEIAASAAPDRALHHMASFITTVGARTSYLHLLLENPGIMRLLVRLFATSEFLSSFFLRHPELLDSLVRADLVRSGAIASDLARELDGAARRRAGLRVGARHRSAASATRSSCASACTTSRASCVPPRCARSCRRWPTSAWRRRSALAWRDVTRRARAARRPARRDGLAVVAMGKLGGEELNYHSDLDLIFVYDAGRRRLVARARRAARVLHPRRAADDQRAPDADAGRRRLPHRHAAPAVGQPGSAGVVARGVRGLSPRRARSSGSARR